MLKSRKVSAMYQNPYMVGYNPQITKDRIDYQIAQLQQMKEQMSQSQQQMQPAINQTIQLAPNSQSSMKFVNAIDDVQKELIFTDTPFFSKDLSVMWIKNIKGDIKAYEIKEIVQRDDKDLMIESLQMQINELKKGMIENAKSVDTDVDGAVESQKSPSVSSSKSSKK